MMKSLKAGPFDLQYRDGFLRRIQYGNTEVIRMIYFALRDEHWGTLPLTIENEQVKTSDKSFEISYHASNFRDGVKLFEWQIEISGKEDGSIIFSLEGKVLQDIWKNRAGLCLLHPLEMYKGTSCEITHPDDTKEVLQFPDAIADDNPFKEIKKMKWSIDGLGLHASFEGDIFETEDQRNWGDASFKTFCTPLAKPFPALMKKGEKVKQKITFTVASGILRQIDSSKAISLQTRPTVIDLPQIGIGESTEISELSAQVIKQISVLKFHHYRIEVDCSAPGWKETLIKQCDAASQLNLPFEIAVTTSDDFVDELDQLFHVTVDRKMKMSHLLLLTKGQMVTNQPLIDHVSVIKAKLGKVRVGVGTNYNFKEINSNRFNSGSVDFISLSMDPQEHAFDDMTLLENTESLFDIVTSAQKIYPGKAIHVSPLLLKRRFNPYSKDPAALVIPESLRIDIRQTQQFCAVFTLACLKNLIASGCKSLTCYQAAGLQGIISVDGKPYPVYDALKSFLNADKIQLMTSSHATEVDGVILKSNNQSQLLIWNLTTENRKIQVQSRELELFGYQIMQMAL